MTPGVTAYSFSPSIQKQTDICECEVSLVYRVTFSIARAIERDPFSTIIITIIK